MATLVSPHQLTSAQQHVASQFEEWLDKERGTEHLSEEQSHNLKVLFQTAVCGDDPLGEIEANLKELETALQLTSRNVDHIAKIEKEILRTSVQIPLKRSREACEVKEDAATKRQRLEPPELPAKANLEDEEKKATEPPARALPPEQKNEELVCVDVSQVRAFPPHGCTDTMCGLKEGKVLWAHDGEVSLFQDEEIIERCHLKKRKQIGLGASLEAVDHKLAFVEYPIYVAYTQYEKAILQQQAGRGCTAAVSAMLILDHGGKINLCELQCRNLGNDRDIMRDIQVAGLTPLRTTLEKQNFPLSLRKAIQDHGSAIVSIGGEIGGHVIVVDDVSEKLDSVRLRDPYHGWEITITAKAFLQRNPEPHIIQIQTIADHPVQKTQRLSLPPNYRRTCVFLTVP